MRSSRFIWGTIGLTASITTIAFAVGFGYAANQIWFPKASGTLQLNTEAPKKETMIESKAKLQIVALGDSLTAGTGDNTGKGYVGRVREKLEQETGKPVFVLNNLAIPGYKSDQLLADLALKKTQDALAQADIVLLTIGGNDIFAGGEGLFTGDNQTEFNPEAAVSRVTPALEKMDKILQAINQANPKATVLYVGLYHPFLDLDAKREGSLIVQRWNNGVFELINRYPQMIIVPTYDLFEQNLMKYLSSSDHFHPNADGYERIADRILQILK
ncbi:GDSL-type esterase/lipase family protein [Paenibacillus sp. GCM10023248]|uniref:GDSL-type esterase/lipase family protein n=1 Tax=Bacillales TaxID=1385 RepID=UPI002378851A|nr:MULTISPECIES: GDSL-type esterase/lipase family protein [Bacillales]MDD9267720.1 GDSL-type esterase/lipase family protein [Paenibacillus sp. MAHUQ-63]MDR6882180.1 lysophospholipase L1-like esterase [Bacillus sp. 3255]